jgi:hypothetical protein
MGKEKREKRKEKRVKSKEKRNSIITLDVLFVLYFFQKLNQQYQNHYHIHL